MGYSQPARYRTLPQYVVVPDKYSLGGLLGASTHRYSVAISRRRVGDTMDRLTISEAADRLGVTRDAVRKRIKRNSIQWEDGPDGETYVYVDVSETTEDTSGDTSGQAATNLLVESLQEQVEYLRREVEAWQEEARRKDHLLAAALERIPELEAPSETAESPENAGEGSGSTQVGEEQQEAISKPWWRRLFGA